MQIKLSSWYFTLIKKTVRYPKLHINATEIERTDHFNFLGLQLNHNLKWNTHINYVSLKISKVTGLLYKLTSVYPITILKSIYNTLVLPHINYCILSWGSQIDRIHLLQKRAIRNISKGNFKAHTEPLFNPIRSGLFQTVNDPGGGALKLHTCIYFAE